VTLTAIRKNKM